MILRYAALMLLIAAVGSGGFAWWRGGMAGPVERGALLGAALAALGAIGGTALLGWSLGRGEAQFFGALMLGILGRLAVFGGVLIYLGLRPGSFDLVATAVSLLGFYVVFQVLEMRFALRRSAGRRTEG